MVIGPRELEERIRRQETDAIQQFETTIDRALMTTYQGQGRQVTVNMPRGNQVRDFVLRQLLDRYRQAGWDVREQHDQRDGDFIQFTHHQNRNAGRPCYDEDVRAVSMYDR